MLHRGNIHSRTCICTLGEADSSQHGCSILCPRVMAVVKVVVLEAPVKATSKELMKKGGEEVTLLIRAYVVMWERDVGKMKEKESFKLNGIGLQVHASVCSRVRNMCLWGVVWRNM